MTRIRHLRYLDIGKIKKMVSYLNDEGLEITKSLEAEILAKVQNLLPLRFNFFPESFVLTDKNKILGLITVAPTSGNPYKINITRLVFAQNMYDVGRQLVEFIIAKFGAKGAVAFSVMINENDDELMNLFINGCGFRQCSVEVLWRFDKSKIDTNTIKINFRKAQNNDSKQIAALFNGELKSVYKPSLLRKKNEFKEPFFEGFSKFYKTRYVLEEPSDNRIIAYISITTSDNRNFILDICANDGYSIDYSYIMNFAVNDIRKYKSDFSIFVKQKKYSKNSENLEKFLQAQNASPIQTQHVLIKDYYKSVKQESFVQVFSLGEKLSLTMEQYKSD